MLAGTSDPFDSDRFLFEIKWDGIRALAFFDRGAARLQGRKLTDRSTRYPEIVSALRELPGDGVLDGEIVVLDSEGRPDFQRVLMREQTHSALDALSKSSKHPAAYMAFDLLARNGESLLELPLLERKRRLSGLLKSPPSPIVESAYVLGKGLAFYQEAARLGLEGVMAKRIESRYLPGERSRDWLKLKVRLEVDAVLVGLVRERGTKRVKSLVLGGYREGALVWIGNVGSGLDETTLSGLSNQLDGLRGPRPEGFAAQAPGAIDWLEPRLVVRASYSELTHEGRLRHPVFVGFVDKRPGDCPPPPELRRGEP
jgi:bifunctional non-homologous end joining protein LigD